MDEKFLIDDRQVVLPRDCILCRHLFQKGHPSRCKAFPRGIPALIASGQISHREPVEGDHGIQWQEVSLSELDQATKVAGEKYEATRREA